MYQLFEKFTQSVADGQRVFCATDSRTTSCELANIAATHTDKIVLAINSETSSEQQVKDIIEKCQFPHVLIVSPSIVEAVSIPAEHYDVEFLFYGGHTINPVNMSQQTARLRSLCDVHMCMTDRSAKYRPFRNVDGCIKWLNRNASNANITPLKYIVGDGFEFRLDTQCAVNRMQIMCLYTQQYHEVSFMHRFRQIMTDFGCVFIDADVPAADAKFRRLVRDAMRGAA